MKKMLAALFLLSCFSGFGYAESITAPPNKCYKNCTSFGCYCPGTPHNCCMWCSPPPCNTSSTPEKHCAASEA